MTISAPRAVASSTSVRTRFFQWLRPLDLGGQQGIKSLDGLRAVAALMVVSYHIIGVITRSPALGGLNIHFIWQYLASGVLLFFVLSGFLLFLPYVRAMLDGRPLPAARRFYENRAYESCLHFTSVFSSLLRCIDKNTHLRRISPILPFTSSSYMTSLRRRSSLSTDRSGRLRPNGNSICRSHLSFSARRPRTSVLGMNGALARCVLDCPHTAGPAGIYACGADSTTKSPTNV